MDGMVRLSRQLFHFFKEMRPLLLVIGFVAGSNPFHHIQQSIYLSLLKRQTKGSEREDWIELVGPETYNLLLRNAKKWNFFDGGGNQ